MELTLLRLHDTKIKILLLQILIKPSKNLLKYKGDIY